MFWVKIWLDFMVMFVGDIYLVCNLFVRIYNWFDEYYNIGGDICRFVWRKMLWGNEYNMGISDCFIVDIG